MTFHQLRIFQAVAKHLSVTHAADDLHLSQPCVSMQLKLLESEFGTRFYVRKGHGIKLTKEGVVLLRTIRPILKQIEELKRTFETRAATTTNVLEIATSQNKGAALLPRVLADFRKTQPNVRVSVKWCPSRLVERMVIDEEVEIGFVTNPSYSAQLITRPLLSEGVVAAVSCKHPLAKKGELSHEELSTTPACIWLGGIIPTELRRAGLRLNVVLECESSEQLKASVQSGLGLGFFFRSTADASLRSGHLKRIRIPRLEQIIVKTSVVYLSKRNLSPQAEHFITLLGQHEQTAARYRERTQKLYEEVH